MNFFYLPWPDRAPEWAWEYAVKRGVFICCFGGYENALAFEI